MGLAPECQEGGSVLQQPLSGIRVLDWGAWQAGPGAAAMLGDLGADVIKIEDSVMGDPSRGLEPGFDIKYKNPRQGYYELNNRNKRGMTVDLRKAEGRELVYKLVKEADVFLTNFRESVVKKYEMEYETLSKYNPKLIYAAINGYGSKGPDADERSYDAIAQARSALMAQCDPDEPHYIIGGTGDSVPAIMCTYGVMTALFTRERQGIGQKVEVSQLSTLMFMQWANLSIKFIGGFPIAPRSRKNPMNPLVNSYQCKDGKWFYLCNMEADKYWPGFCKALELEHLQDDDRFNTPTKRASNEELVSIVDRVFASREREDWVPILRENGLVFTRVNSYDDLLTDEQVVANDYLPLYEHPIHGSTRYPPIPIALSKTPGSYWLPAPQFGQHTEEVLMEVLGYSWEDIGRLKEAGVI